MMSLNRVVVLSHNNLFAFEAFLVIDDVCLALFTMRSLKTLFNKSFMRKIFYFSICLTSNKLYWIEDLLADVFTQFYTSVSWRW